jgi:hypothetical protein
VLVACSLIISCGNVVVLERVVYQVLSYFGSTFTET